MVGPTTDGFVYISFNITFKGEPVQFTIHWNPNDAWNIAEGIRQAVEGIRGKGNGGNGKDPH